MKKILLFFMFLFLILPSQVNATQFNGYTNNTSMNSTDELILWDTPNGAVRNITFANFGVSLESPLELIIDLQDLQGSVTDSQVPNTITVDLSTTATTANNLAADGVNALTEIDQSIKTAANDTSKLVVGTAGATDDCAKWDANGNLVSAGAACGVGGGGGGLNNIVEDLTPQLGGDLDMNGNGIDFPTTVNITDVLDEDSMTSNSPTALATQQSIKAYVDNSVAAAGGGDITSVGNCTTSACFGGASGNTLTSTTSEIIDMSTASTFIYQRDDAGSVTFMGKDNSTPADTIYDTFGAGSVTVGSGDVTAVTITTDGTGTGELVVPNDSITLGTETVGNYAAGDAESGAATTGDTATAFFSTGQIERARGGTGADTSAYGAGILGSDGSNNTIDIDTEAELETALGGTDVVVVTNGDITSANLDTIVSDNSGSGLVVFGTSPTIATPILTGKIDRNNVAVDDDDCTGEQGIYWYDTTDSAFEFCNASSGAPTVLGGGGASPGGADTYVQYNDGGAMGGDAGMVFNETTNALTVDGTGTFDGLVVSGAGTDSLLSTNGIFDLGGTTQERLRLTFTGSDIVTATSTTGATTFNFSSIALQESGLAVLNNDEIDASSELLAIMDDETGSGLLAFATNPLFTGARFGNGATSGGFLDIVEDTDNGTNRIRFTAPSAITSDVECILENDGSPIPDSCVGDGTDGGGGGAFSDASDPVVLNTTTKDVAVGAALINAAKLSVDGDADQVQFAIQSHSTQTSNVIEIENSGGVNQFVLNNFGVLTTWHGGTLGDSDTIAFDGVNVFGSGPDLTVDGTLLPTTLELPNSTSLPATCQTGQIYFDTDATSGRRIYGCQSTNTWALQGDGGGGSSTQAIVINPSSMSLTGTIALTGDATQGAQIDASNGGVLLFDATTDEGAGWRGKLPSNWSAHGTIKINYSMTSGTANEVEWEAAIMCTSPGDSARDDADSFAAFAVASDTVPGTVRFLDTVSITPTDDSCAAGDDIMINISTDSDDATNDDATGDRRLIGVVYEYTSS